MEDTFFEMLTDLMEQGSYEQVLEQTEEALKQDPNEADCYLYQGYAYQAMAEFDKAMDAFQMAILKDPSDSFLRIAYGRFCEDMGQDVEALNAYDSALFINPESEDAPKYAGDILVQNGQLEQAANAYHLAFVNNPEDWDLGNQLAELYATLGDMDEAVKLYPELLQKNPTFTMQMKYGSALLFFLQNGAPHTEIAQAAVEWKEKYPKNAFVTQFADALITNQVHYNPMSLANIKALFDCEDTSFRETEIALPIAEILSKTEREVTPSKVVMDMGCGSGYYADVLKPYSALLIGTDVSTVMLDKAHAKGLYDKLFNCDFMSVLNAKPNTFDLLFAVRLFDYTLLTQDIVQKMASALKTDGKAFFTIRVNQLNEEPVSFMPPFKYGYNPKSVSEMLRMAGLTVIDETPYSTGAENLIIYTVLKV